jgi:Fic family protein
MEAKIINLFKSPFIKDFIIVPSRLPFSESELRNFDKILNKFERLYLNPDIEKNLITRNELLASFAISKAEYSSLTIKEAKEVYDLVVSGEDYSFINKKLKQEKKLSQHDHDRLEFFNIAKTFREFNQKSFNLSDLSINFIQEIHNHLTRGMDIFQKYLSDFTPYKTGRLRDNDDIRVGSYIPAPYKLIPECVQELTSWFKKNPSIVNTAIFHTTLYAIHPFNNGNKRVCRILEHLILRALELNSRNLFSTSYYYHEEKPRYYKYLLASLERQNLTYFASFVSEAFAFSVCDVMRSSLKQERLNFVSEKTDDKQIKRFVRPLIKRKQLQFKTYFAKFKKSMARQTFVNLLQETVNRQILKKKDIGKQSFYSLNFSPPEEETLKKLLATAKKHLGYIPDKLKLSVGEQ